MKDNPMKDEPIKWRLLLLVSFIIASFIVHPAVSAESAVTFLTPEQLSPHQKTIDRVEKYLSGLTTIIADFTQAAPDGSISTGVFYLKRPGMMRWQYKPPTPILMVADGNELIFYDYELEQITHIPLDSTLVGFLAQKTIRFSGGMVGITNIEEKDKVIRIEMAQKKKPDEGLLMLELSDQPLQIRNMVVTDTTKQTTTISLNHAKYGEELKKELFVFIDPRKKKR